MAGPSDTSEAEARAVVALVKFIGDEELFWRKSPDHGTQMIFSCALLDEVGATIPGLTAELAFRVPPRYDDCKYTFSIFSFRPGGRLRAYQLEVIPEEDKGHNDDLNPCYGPHEHIGTHVEELRVSGLSCAHHEKWFRVFLQRANIGYGGRYVGPFDGGMFS